MKEKELETILANLEKVAVILDKKAEAESTYHSLSLSGQVEGIRLACKAIKDGSVDPKLYFELQEYTSPGWGD